MNKIQQEAFDILVKIEEIARKNNINYSIAGGTALGAVRSGKFIPWDDDIDIDVDHDDLEHFSKLLNDNLPKDKYQVVSPSLFNKGKHNEGMVISKSFPVKQEHYDHKKIFSGVRVDIVGVYKSNSPKYSKWFKFWLFWKWARNFRPSFWLSKANIVVKVLPQKWIDKKIKKHYLKEKDDNGKYTKNPTLWPALNGKVWTFDKPKKDNLMDIEFEGKTFKIYKHYDLYLRELYGDDYMTPPPEKERKNHGIVEK